MKRLSSGARVGMHATMIPSQSSSIVMRAMVTRWYVKSPSSAECTVTGNRQIITPIVLGKISREIHRNAAVDCPTPVNMVHLRESNAKRNANCDFISHRHLQLPQPRKWQNDDSEIN